ncbi:MAG: T9SS type A sorting domain-containing protein, partial [Chitinophagales bacterium]
VIYTDVNPDKELGGSLPSSFPAVTYDTLDLNNDGVFDFKVTMSMYGTDAGVAGLSFLERIDGAFNPVYNQVLNYTIDYHPWAIHLECGDSIPINLPNFSWSYANFALQFPNNVSLNWNNIHDQYVGLRFKSSDGIHFGWVKLDVNTTDTIPNIVIKSYAYEATPNKKIAACDSGLASGINSPEIKNLSLAPNPSDGRCVISLQQPLQEDAEVSVNDMQGRKVFRSIVPANSSNELLLDLPQLAAGVYVVQLKSENVLLTGKWIRK